MRPSRVCVPVSQNVTVRCVEYAMNFPCFGRAMHEEPMLSETGHSETLDAVDAPNYLILLSDTTKRWLLNQRRPVLNHGFTVAGMCTSKEPSLLSQTRTKLGVVVAIRSPCGLLSPTYPRGRVFVLVRELQCPRWMPSGYSTQR